MKRYIKTDSAPEKVSQEDLLNELMGTLKDNFNFAMDGIDKIASDGDVSGALEKARTLNEMIDGAIGEIAEDIAID